MGRKISTHQLEKGKGYCEVHMNFKEEMAYIKYFDDNDRLFYSEEYPNKPLVQVQIKAEDWAAGLKKLVDM